MDNPANNQQSETTRRTPPPVVYETQQNAPPESRGEWIKFAILLAVCLGIILAVMLSRPLVFGHVVPAVMGDFLTNEVSLPDTGDAVMDEGDGENAGNPPPETNTETPTDPNTTYPPPADTTTDTTTPPVDDTAPPVDTTTTNEPDAPVVAEPVVEENDITEDDLNARPVEGDSATVTHIVQPGHTLSAIAGRYGVTVEAIMSANGMTDPDRITVGDVLTIP